MQNNFILSPENIPASKRERRRGMSSPPLKGTPMDLHESSKGIKLRSMIIAGGIPTVTVMLAAFAIGICIAVILF